MAKSALGFPLVKGLLSCQENERRRRAEGLPPVEVGLHLVGKRESGFIEKGLRGEVVCEIDNGKFDVFVSESAISEWLVKNGYEPLELVGSPHTEGKSDA